MGTLLTGQQDTPALCHGNSALVVTSVLTSPDVNLTSGNRSPDETYGTSGSVTHSIFVRFTSNFVHLHPLPLPFKKGSCHGSHSLIFFSQSSHLTGTWRNHWREGKCYVTFCAEDLVKKHSTSWDNDHPKCHFCDKGYRFRTFTTQCNMTSQIKGSGKQSRVTEICIMESKTDDTMKARFLVVRKEIYNRYTVKE